MKEYERHVRHIHAWLARYSWCGECLEGWDKTACDADMAALLVMQGDYYQPCGQCVKRMRAALAGQLSFKRFVDDLGDRYIKPKVLNVLPDDDRRAALMEAYLEAERKRSWEYEGRYVEDVNIRITQLPKSLHSFLHVHFWGVPLPSGLQPSVAVPLEHPGICHFRDEYIATLVQGWNHPNDQE
jgi:hypothetical protein